MQCVPEMCSTLCVPPLKSPPSQRLPSSPSSPLLLDSCLSQSAAMCRVINPDLISWCNCVLVYLCTYVCVCICVFVYWCMCVFVQSAQSWLDLANYHHRVSARLRPLSSCSALNYSPRLLLGMPHSGPHASQGRESVSGFPSMCQDGCILCILCSA